MDWTLFGEMFGQENTGYVYRTSVNNREIDRGQTSPSQLNSRNIGGEIDGKQLDKTW